MAVLKINFYAQSLMRPVDVNVILPADNPNTDIRHNPKGLPPYKTLYLLHGIMGDYNDWLMYSDIARLARKHNLAVVMPSGDNQFYINQPNRLQNYSDFLTDELPCMMEKMLPLSQSLADRFVGGLSMGGYGALINGLQLPQRFSHIFGLSSALILEDVYHLTPPAYLANRADKIEAKAYYESIFGNIDGIKNSDKDYQQLATRLAEQAKKRSEPLPKILLSCGQDDDFATVNRTFAKQLQQLGYDLTYIDNQGGHNWAYWAKMLHEVFAWLPVENVELG